MAVSEDYKNYILDQLSEVEEVAVKKMFGGVGLFREGKMFGMVTSKDEFRLKVDEFNKEDYVSRGMEPMTSPKHKGAMPYWTVPVEVLEDRQVLAEWASKSIEAALRKKK